MNLLESIRAKLVNAQSEEITVEQYAVITSKSSTPHQVFAIHDSVFGGNLRKIPYDNLFSGPFVPFNNEPDIPPFTDEDVEPYIEHFPAPELPELAIAG